jgi:hypothetical protein
MDARTAELVEKLERSLADAAEAAVELDRAKGVLRGVPHYSVIELRAHRLGRQLSCAIQQRELAEVVAQQAVRAKCPACDTSCELVTHRRGPITSIDGELSLLELKGHCPCCRRDFFPSADSVGL